MKLPTLGTQCLIALALGLIYGFFASPQWIDFVVPFGEAFLKLLQMLVLPLTVSTIIASLSKQENLLELGALSKITLFWFLITACAAVLIALMVGVALNPGKGIDVLPLADMTQWKPRELPTFRHLFLDLIPGNLIHTFASSNILPGIIFAFLFGIAICASSSYESTIRIFFQELSQAMFQMTRWIIRCSPIAVFSLIAPVAAAYGIAGLKPLFWFIIAIYLACGLQLIFYGILIMLLSKYSVKTFYKGIWPAIVMAFSTSSSMATLPVTISALRGLGVKEKIVGFVAPLGSTMKMDGCGGIYPVIVAIFTANLFGYSLSVEQYFLLSLTAVIATIGTAGVPGTASMMAIVSLTAVGLPLEGLAILMSIDKVVDTIRTVTNVTGTATNAVLIAESFDQKR